MASGRAIQELTIEDECTRECLRLGVDISFASRRVTRALEKIVAERGAPGTIRCDNGPGADQPAFSSVVHRAADRGCAHSAREAAAKRVRGKFQRRVVG